MEDKKNEKFSFVTLRYELIGELGGGTFGKVYKGIKDNRDYAIKKLYRHDNGIQLTTIREIKSLRNVYHENIINLLEINVHEDDIYLVFPYFRFDLTKYLSKNIPNKFETVHIINQIVEGLAYLHKKEILHRDLKPANILMDFNLNVKIADFGMARNMSQTGMYSPGVVTLWYRAPELILGEKNYGTQIDVWSVGCIAAEILLGYPLFQGNSEIKMLESIIYICGTINQRTWPSIHEISGLSSFNLPQSPRNLRKVLKSAYSEIVDIIDKILVVDPNQRVCLEEVLDQKIFKSHDKEFINKIGMRYNERNYGE
ncbi:Cyclin-dependent kinase C-2 [Nosema bombycis CQ1]|uniref:Cyclin-dependent kinase C-2 n=1 Tax=Nosema bombycis (strain CQ1 / CVCC 102059) TaxID=578461 RepID=R0MHV8_NOSB1|nr:Cyclin-dependent kinase C-2 [Nosema bombycis CQ1]|eukprot:EOB12358.1 Cyclin-dependent kinase C-2 [Nosema bombycis CQ1]